MKKVLWFIYFFSISLFNINLTYADNNYLGTERALFPSCTEKKMQLLDWVKTSSVIFTGKAEKSLTKFPSETYFANRCWIQFTSINTLKSTLPDKIWVEMLYDPYIKNYNKISNCPIKINEFYIVFGNLQKQLFYQETSSFITSALSQDSALACPPVLMLKSNLHTVSKIRSIIGEMEK